MARNGLAGTKKGNSNTAKYYQKNPEAKKKKAKYDTKYHSTPARIKYRGDLSKANAKIGKKGDGKDVSHTSNGKFTLEKQSTNRARQGSNGGSTKKPVKVVKKVLKNKKK